MRGTCLSSRDPEDPASFRTAAGFIAMSAAAVHAAAAPAAPADFVRSLREAAAPTGRYQYYGRMLYRLGVLEASGRFRVYGPVTGPVVGCG